MTNKWECPPDAVWVWGKYGKYEETYCHAEEIKQEEFEIPVTKYIRADLATLSSEQARDALTELDQLRDRVKVKPLEWRKGRAETPFGPYHVIEETNDDEPFWFVMFNGKAAARCGTHDDEESAIFAAQADYERRILSALED